MRNLNTQELGAIAGATYCGGRTSTNVKPPSLFSCFAPKLATCEPAPKPVCAPKPTCAPKPSCGSPAPAPAPTPAPIPVDL